MGLADRYLTKLPENFGDAFTSGIKKRQDFEESQRLDERRIIGHDQAIQQSELKQKQLDRQNAFDAKLQELTVKSDPRALVNLSKEFPDMMGEDMMEQISAQEKRVHTTLGAPVYAAAKNGSYDLAAKKAREAAAMLRSYGAEDEANLYDSYAEDFEDEKTRGAAVFTAGASLMQIMGREEFETMFDVAKTEAETEKVKSDITRQDTLLGGEVAQQYGDLAKTSAETAKTIAETSDIAKERQQVIDEATRQFNLDQAKLAKLPESAIKSINTAVENSETQLSIYTKADELSSKLAEVERTVGLAGEGKSLWAKLFGSQKEGDNFRTELNALMNEDILGRRKPGMGPMSDNDYKVLRAGAPPVDASGAAIKNYLGALKRFSAFATKREEYKAEFLTQNKHMGNSSEGFTIGGKHKVKKGETFPQFIRRLGDKVYEDMGTVPKMGAENEIDDDAFVDSL